MQDKIHNWRATALTPISIMFIAAIFWFIGMVSQYNGLIMAVVYSYYHSALVYTQLLQSVGSLFSSDTDEKPT
jgi:hypothetical protein